MPMKLISVDVDRKSVLRHLLELYKYDFSEFDPKDVNEHGLYEYKYLDHYWTEEGRYPYLFQVDGKWAGFAFVRKVAKDQLEAEAAYYWMAEFFVMKKYRRSGVGRSMAVELFRMFPGRWRVGQVEANVPAQAFWRRVIGTYTGNRYEEITAADWDGPMQQFISEA
jgi:predicted acetyltransferase